jgi:signal transduction histidine kinase
MAIDLEQVYDIQEIRLYATHARLGADIPGFSFPARFIIEAALTSDFLAPIPLLQATEADFPNPGDNAITIPTAGTQARHIRIRLPNGDTKRFSFSEVEVYAADKNVARHKTVTSSHDPSTYSSKWPRSLLVDGFTSYGRLMELPEWLNQWQQRAQLELQLQQLNQRREVLGAEARQRFWWVLLLLGCTTMGAIGGWLFLLRRRRGAELDALRRRMARDMHDEIGSNLAAIARLSEVSASSGAESEDWKEVHRIAQESMDGMREVLWLAGAREEAGPELAGQIKRLVERLLSGYDVQWIAPLESLPTNWTSMARRELFLFVKESLANVVRHAQTTVVIIGVTLRDGRLIIEINDQGVGFDPSTVKQGVGLQSMMERARTIGGALTLTSQPGKGTHVHLSVAISQLV